MILEGFKDIVLMLLIHRTIETRVNRRMVLADILLRTSYTEANTALVHLIVIRGSIMLRLISANFLMVSATKLLKSFLLFHRLDKVRLSQLVFGEALMCKLIDVTSDYMRLQKADNRQVYF